MAASRRLDSRVANGYWRLCVYAWVPSQEDLHRLWRADELQAGPKQKRGSRAPRLRVRPALANPIRTGSGVGLSVNYPGIPVPPPVKKTLRNC